MLFFKRKFKKNVPYRSIRQIDLSSKSETVSEDLSYLYESTIVDSGSAYLGHPDSVLLKNGDILTLYPEGHGKGRILSKISCDGGTTYKKELESTPRSWEHSLETPTVYRLKFTDGNEKLILISGNPKWPKLSTPGGFNCSISEDEGKSWSEFKLFWDKSSDFPTVPIVSMASLIQLKENGKFVDKWLGFFHDSDFVNYKTVLTFQKDGTFQWSKPEPYLSKYRDFETFAGICEVCAIRSENGTGDEICLIARCNKKTCTSLMMFSNDEGKNWSEPVEAPVELNGERHKALYTDDGRLFITFRSIERSRSQLKKVKKETETKKWYSEGWVAWVGKYEDLKNQTCGQYRIKLAHTYLDRQASPSLVANPDTGYCGNVILNDGTIVTCSYGIFSAEEKKHGKYSTDKGKQKRKTFILSKRIRLEDTDKL